MNKGFTLIELVFVIILLAVLVAVAIPKFLSFSTDAKISVLKQVQTSIKVANDFMFLKSKMPSYAARDVPNRDDLIDVDTNGDGVYDTRLKWGHLDNTDLDKAVDFSDDFTFQERGYSDTFIGYDIDNDGNVSDDGCYFQYTQASSATTPPLYLVVETGC
ncbi:pilus assembly protein PilD [Psychromonas sp. psych-6C06]|nr:type II secretion system protein [Psychromonas sp. psych-6C06]PKF63871.1 pilus assembly protein PilD [Psychromonas sp. psych-6C06]